jgi:hypothetical protein
LYASQQNERPDPQNTQRLLDQIHFFSLGIQHHAVNVQIRWKQWMIAL